MEHLRRATDRIRKVNTGYLAAIAGCLGVFASPVFKSCQEYLDARSVEEARSENPEHEELLRNILDPTNNKLRKTESKNPCSDDVEQNIESFNTGDESERELVDDVFVNKIIALESGRDTYAVGSSGERGLMQIMEGTWYEMSERLYGERLNFDKAFDSEINREVGTFYAEYIADILSSRIGNWDGMDTYAKQRLIIAAYNGGHFGMASKGDIAEMPESTREHVKKFDALLEKR